MLAYLSLLRRHPELLGFGVLLTFSSSLGQTFFISVFGAEIRGDFGLSHGDFGAVYSIATLLSAGTLLWAGKLVDRVPLERFTLVVVAGLALATGLLALAPNALILGVAIYGLRLAGQGLCTHTSITAMARSFDGARGRAISIATLGLPVGEMAFPPLGVAAITLGWRLGWGLFALALLGGLLPLLIWLLRRAFRRMERSPAAGDGDGGAADSERSWSRMEVLRDPRFYLLMPGMLASSVVITGLFFHQVHIVESKGWSLIVFASAFTGYAIASVTSALVIGWLIDRFSARVVVKLLLPVLIAGCLMLASFDAALVIWPMMITLGFAQGGHASTQAALWAELYGTAEIGSIRSLTAALGVFGSALSPVTLGWLFDFGMSVETVVIGCAVFTLIGWSLYFPALRMPVTAPAKASTRHMT